eukprot:6242399-Pyramimonas_sp.AAC.1
MSTGMVQSDDVVMARGARVRCLLAHVGPSCARQPTFELGARVPVRARRCSGVDRRELFEGPPPRSPPA